MGADEEYELPLLPNHDADGDRWAKTEPAISSAAALRRLALKLLLAVYICISATLSIKWFLSSPSPITSPATSSQASTDHASSSTDHANGFESSIVLTLKTGSAVLYSRGPVQLMHLAQSRQRPTRKDQWHEYIPNQIVYSDAEEWVAGLHVKDIIQKVPEDVRRSVEIFKEYEKLQALLANYQDPTATSKRGSDSRGWELDKYKFLPLHADVYKQFPDAKYTVSVEADTFLFWNQLLKWLKMQDAKGKGADDVKMWGNGVLLNDISFAHGGSGYVISRGLNQQTFGKDPSFQDNATFLSFVDGSCCGDAELAHAFQVRIPGWDPNYAESEGLFMGQSLRGFHFSPNDWCDPVFTLHPVSPFDYVQLDNFKRRIEPLIGADDYIRRTDLWDGMMPSFLRIKDNEEGEEEEEEAQPKRRNRRRASTVKSSEDDNVVTVKGWRAIPDGAGELQKNITSEVACHETCQAAEENRCLTWTFQIKGSKCYHSGDTFIGQGVKKFISGYFIHRIEDVRSKHDCVGRLGDLSKLMPHET